MIGQFSVFKATAFGIRHIANSLYRLGTNPPTADLTVLIRDVP
jgi:hypothetical protein